MFMIISAATAMVRGGPDHRVSLPIQHKAKTPDIPTNIRRHFIFSAFFTVTF